MNTYWKNKLNRTERDRKNKRSIKKKCIKIFMILNFHIEIVFLLFTQIINLILSMLDSYLDSYLDSKLVQEQFTRT
jgi:hypothetical protein